MTLSLDTTSSSSMASPGQHHRQTAEGGNIVSAEVNAALSHPQLRNQLRWQRVSHLDISYRPKLPLRTQILF